MSAAGTGEPVSAMIGREAELKQLSELLAGKAAGLVLLIGGAKIGKTPLLLALRDRAGHAGWAVYPAGGTEPLHVDPSTTAGQLPGISQDRGEIAGTLLLIHHYQPSERFHVWFTREYVPSLTKAKAVMLVVVAGYERDTADLEPLARMTLRLGPLASVPVREHLVHLGQALADPLSEAELTAYVTAACESPEILEALERLLTLEAELHPRAESGSAAGST
jgi:hypothetical protein